jgi:hypothetical protein
MQRGTRLERDETILENTSPWLMFSQAAFLPSWFLAQSTLSLNLALDLLLALLSPPPTPLAAPVEQCAWCWSQLHPGQPYPEHWSSMTCALHGAALNWQRVERRKRRLTHAVTSN